MNFVSHMFRDSSLISRRVVQNGKIVHPKLFALPPPQDRAGFDTNFWDCLPTGLTALFFIFIFQMLSAIRADCNVIFSEIVSPHEGFSVIGRWTDINYKHCRVKLVGSPFKGCKLFTSPPPFVRLNLKAPP